MATIRRRNGLWQAQVRRRGYPAISRTFTTKAFAEKWATDTESEMMNGGPPKQRSNITFSDAVQRYLCQKRDVFSQTRSMAKRSSRDLGAYHLDNITPKILCDWRDTLLTEGKAQGHSPVGLSNQTVRLHLGFVSVVFSAAIKRWHIFDGPNPCRLIEMPSVAHNGRTRVFSRDEVDRITTGLSGPLRAFIWLAFETAMRRGEIARIRREDLNVERATLHIPITKTGRPRTIPLSPSAIGFVFDLLDGTDKATVTGDHISRVFAERATAEGITNARFHDLRHTATTALFERGLNPVEVATITGHTTTAMLMRYTHIRPETLGTKLYGQPSKAEASCPMNPYA